MGAPSDAALVDAARRGDHAAFDRLAERYRPLVHGLCVALLDDEDDAHDAAQQALVQAHAGLNALRNGERFGAWIGTIARNECRQLARSRGRERRRARELRAAGVPLTAPPPALPADPTLAPTLDRLPAQSRLVVMLSALDGLDSRRIGRFLGIRPDAVRARLSRARSRLTDADCVASSQTAGPHDERSTGMDSYQIAMAGQCPSDGVALFGTEGGATERLLYGRLYDTRNWDDAMRAAAAPPAETEAILDLWLRYGVVERDRSGVHPRVPVALPGDTRRLKAWAVALGSRWAEEAVERTDALEEIAREAVGDGGHAESAVEYMALWLTAIAMDSRMTEMGVTRPHTERPDGRYHLFGWSSGDDDLDFLNLGGDHYGISGPMIRSGPETSLFTVAWCGPHGSGHSAMQNRVWEMDLERLSAALIALRRSPTSRDGALALLEGVDNARGADEALEQLVDWRALTAAEPYRPLVPVLLPELTRRAWAEADAIATVVASFASDSRATLDEIVARCSFAQCNRADVAHVASLRVLGYAATELVRRGVFGAPPASCRAERGLLVTYH